MKTKLILLLATLTVLSVKAQSTVENPFLVVDNGTAQNVSQTGLQVVDTGSVGTSIPLRVATAIYYCKSNENENSFVLAEKDDQASVNSFKGEDLYEGGELKVLSKIYGFLSVQTTYQLEQGDSLVVSEFTHTGRGGGRAGDIGLPAAKSISAKLVINEKENYFSCHH